MAGSPLVKPVYKASTSSSSFPTTSNLYYTLSSDWSGITLPIGFASFVNDSGATATQLYDTSASPSLATNVFIGGALQEKGLVNGYTTSTVTLVFSDTVTIYSTEVVQLAYSGATVATTVTIQ